MHPANNLGITFQTIPVKVYGEDKPIRLTALESVPRLGWQDHFQCGTEVLRQFGVPVRCAMGAYWDHSLERLLEAASNAAGEGPPAYALVLDYDTLFVAEHLRRMVCLAATYPDCPAIAPVQAKRDCDQVLVTLLDENGKRREEAPAEMFDADLVPIASAHFGFTLLRLDCLKSVAKPWLEHKPAPDGSWNEGRVDADVNFWDKWTRAGFGVYLAPSVRVGHLQLTATWVNPDFTVHHQYIADFRKSGPPSATLE